MASQVQTTAGEVRLVSQQVYESCDAQVRAVQGQIDAEKERIASLPWWRRWLEADPDNWKQDIWWERYHWRDERRRAERIFDSVAGYPDEATVLLDFDDARFLGLMQKEAQHG